MNDLVKYECRKYVVQIFKWLKNRYSDNVYDYLVLEDENLVTIKIIMNVTIKFYEKRGLGIVNYIIKTFRRPELIKVNWRYNRNMFNITVICGKVDKTEQGEIL
ncbi:hypothetical protein CCL42_gp25 [Sulfolobus islandicus rod-shaped virus 8]|jgi:hypothetical protein|uniref:Uncharacterized protein n=2 Tax=Usarudivirus TaxID=2843109 RepID=A0A1X9SJF6_9VIRU|nr:hypothetical protein CCL41_gp23 [Sulfolobus islandicus rod-shaped virus 9]YP_009362698.1 hypothetical protein CCL42_gp25 [Sulfolobus islandicus rod-shaped virus 8]ARQ96371.1 hypothetical protein [Sulfolobus islandicus rod-shaped virus 9]ARQ96431.1 hypothetical protein [Sulfolobus islandicus rod-shaped virus 8]